MFVFFLRYVIISNNVPGAMSGFVGFALLFKKFSLIFIAIQYVCVV